MRQDDVFMSNEQIYTTGLVMPCPPCMCKCETLDSCGCQHNISHAMVQHVTHLELIPLVLLVLLSESLVDILLSQQIEWPHDRLS